MTRHDGRRADQLRAIETIHHFLSHTEGSVLIKQGGTWVLCVATLEDDVPPFLRGAGHGWIAAEYALLPRSTATSVASCIECLSKYVAFHPFHSRKWN